MSLIGNRFWHKWHAVQLNHPVPMAPIYSFFESNGESNWMVEHNDTGAKVFVRDDELMIIFKLKFPQ